MRTRAQASKPASTCMQAVRRASAQASELACIQTGKHTREANEQASNQTSRHACKQAGKPASKQASELACIQTNKHTHEKRTSKHNKCFQLAKRNMLQLSHHCMQLVTSLSRRTRRFEHMPDRMVPTTGAKTMITHCCLVVVNVCLRFRIIFKGGPTNASGNA